MVISKGISRGCSVRTAFTGDFDLYGCLVRTAVTGDFDLHGCLVRNSVIEAISVNVCCQRKRTFPPEIAVWRGPMSANPRRPVI